MANGGKRRRDMAMIAKNQKTVHQKSKHNKPKKTPAQHGGAYDHLNNRDGFYNPYTFVPTPDRSTLDKKSFAADLDSLENNEDHSRLWPGRYTGTFHLKLTVETPVFIAKTSGEKRDMDKHQVYDCVDEVPVTSVKGMLRSAYEAITNSRFGVFDKAQHNRRLGYRVQANATLVPARIAKLTNDTCEIDLYPGTSQISPSKANGPLYAAWLPSYKPGHVTPLDNSYETGKQVWAKIVLCQHWHLNKKNNAMEKDSLFWRVVAIKEEKDDVEKVKLQLPPEPTHGKKRWEYEKTKTGDCQIKVVSGWVVKTGKLIGNKHDERVFFGTSKVGKPLDPNALVKDYNALLADYYATHEKGKYPPISENSNSMVPVIHGKHITKKNLCLQQGDFVYALIGGDLDGGEYSVKSIYPVQISRELHPNSPWNCTPESLLPPATRENLSPSDRLFGWVNQESKGAWRGKLRFCQTTMTHPDKESPIERFKEELPLTILGEPKPAQARFYVGNKAGFAQANGNGKREAVYDQNKCIRGRKLYWTPRQVANGSDKANTYWSSPWEDRTSTSAGGYHQEYRQPGRNADGKNVANEKSNQNRSITGWIRRGTVIRFNLRAENLAPEELGGLLQLACLQEWAGKTAVLRLGMGKPLGMGCVRLELDGGEAVAIAETEHWTRYYQSLSCESPSFYLDAENVSQLKNGFGSALKEAYKDQKVDRWTDLNFVRAFVAATAGPADDLPVHYPRSEPRRTYFNKKANRIEPAPSFEWFRQNPGRSLPDACTMQGKVRPTTLPYATKK